MNVMQVGTTFLDITTEQAEAAWAPFLFELKSRSNDFDVNVTFSSKPFSERWQPTDREAIFDDRPKAPKGYFWWKGNASEVAAYWGGYDGRGVWKISNRAELEEVLKGNPQILIEELISFDCEIAVMVARSAHGQATTWAPTQTVQSEGICTLTISPAPVISQVVAEKAQHLALSIANDISLIGVMAVELFVKGDELFINELAMRPHNSGHWTIDGSRTSQFEQHLRAILDLPLGDPAMTAGYAVMANILGGEKTDMYRPYLHLMARNPQLKFHQYKKEVRKGRKIGHVTAVGENLLELTEIAEHARDYMSGEIDE